MIKTKKALLSVLLLAVAIFASGCWNYREMNQLYLVSGLAIDKGTSDYQYHMTVEVLDFSLEGKDSKISSRILESEGHNIFDAARNMIKMSPKKLYWGHSLIIIISEALAKEGIIDVLDWVSRDQETRAETNILISKEATAREILLETKGAPKPIAFDIYRSLKAQKSLSKAPKVEIYQFINTLGAEGVSSILPSISMTTSAKEKTYEVSGTSLFRGDKLIGFIDEEQSKYLLFAIDEVRGGLLLIKSKSSDNHPNISLEILKSSTKVTPDVLQDELVMKINVKVQVALAEIGTHGFSMDESGLASVKKGAEKELEENINKLISRVQRDYGSDIFGFGKLVKSDMAEFWRSEASNWDELFKELKVDVSASIDIKNSALTSKPIKLGD